MWCVVQILFTMYPGGELPSFTPNILCAGVSESEAARIYANSIRIDEMAGYEKIDMYDLGGGKRECYLQSDDTHFAYIKKYKQ